MTGINYGRNTLNLLFLVIFLDRSKEKFDFSKAFIFDSRIPIQYNLYHKLNIYSKIESS